MFNSFQDFTFSQLDCKSPIVPSKNSDKLQRFLEKVAYCFFDKYIYFDIDENNEEIEKWKEYYSFISQDDKEVLERILDSALSDSRKIKDLFDLVKTLKIKYSD